jgi:CRISPR-associated endonuclease/helicase Cas3
MPDGIHIRLGAEYQRLADPGTVSNQMLQVVPSPLQHQVDTVTALAKHDLVINAFPTGTGKTKAALLRLLDYPRSNTLLIAPVNELVRQHARDAQQFVDDAGLPHVVVAVDAAYLRQLPAGLGRRPGDKFYRILTNPVLLPEMQNYQESTKPPLLLVTNPDLFYYGVFYLFNTLDRRNIAEQFIAMFQYIIIDEVHYYNAKQFANLLFFILLSKEFGYFDPDLPQRRKICLLSATPDSDLNHFVERLSDMGIAIHRLDPEPVHEDDPLATKSLTELDLSIYPYTREAAGEFFNHVGHVAALVEQDKDGAILLNSLYGVNRLARVCETRLGVQYVGRITGPLSREERQAAPCKPLLLATPTVDIGFNFEGRRKDRQNLDFVFFEASFEDQFWQRLGRGGRVLGKAIQDIPSTAVALIPDSAYERLHRLIGSETHLSRQMLKEYLREAAESDMQRNSFAEYVQSYSLLEVTQPLVEMDRVLGTGHAPLLDRMFETMRNMYAPSSKKSLWSLRGEIRRWKEFQSLARDLHKPDIQLGKAVIRALRECLQEEYGQSLPEEQIAAHADQVLHNPKAKEQLQQYVAREVMTLQPIFSFRDTDVSIQVEAEDPYGLVSTLRETIPLDLLHLLRFFLWHPQEPGKTDNKGLRVVLEDICEPPLTVTWTLCVEGRWAQFQKKYVKKPTAIKGLQLERSVQGSRIPTPAAVVEAVSQQYVPCLVLENESLKPWMWGNLIRDGIYPCDLTVTFAETGQGSPLEKKLRLYTGLDGYRVMARYGWSIQRTTGEWWVV